MTKFISIPKNILLLACVVHFSACAKKESYTPQTHTVEIKDMKFAPENLTVHQGDTVLWINKDIVAHDVTQQDKKWASQTLASGDSWKKAIEKSDSYYCSIHLVMKGKLIVAE